jgi:hypothetical protein
MDTAKMISHMGVAFFRFSLKRFQNSKKEKHRPTKVITDLTGRFLFSLHFIIPNQTQTWGLDHIQENHWSSHPHT